MAEELIESISENNEPVEFIEREIDAEDLDNSVSTQESVHIIEVQPVEEVSIEFDEGTGWVGGDTTRHYSLSGRDEPDQHPIRAIVGLRNELDQLEALQTVYSDAVGTANFYKWNSGTYDEVGYFVSIVPKTSTIQICDGPNIFGVTVSAAGFIGGQDGVTLDYVNGIKDAYGAARDSSYALVVTSGLVDVRCESSIRAGDYVVSNSLGIATQAASEYGYKVLAVNNKYGINYASISLGVQACITDALGQSVQFLEDDMEDAKINIASAMNLANEAYRLAQESAKSSQETSDKYEDINNKVDNTTTDIFNMEEHLQRVAEISVQSKAIAENAVTAAETARNEAEKATNAALSEASKLRTELENKTIEINEDLNNAALKLEEAKEDLYGTTNELSGRIDNAVEELENLVEDLEPLAAWPDPENPTGIAGFVAKANEDSALLSSITKFEGEFGESISGFVQEATKENATVKAIASYQQKDENGNIIGDGAAGLIGQVDANTASINLLTKFEGDGFESLSGLVAQTNANSASITTLASHVIGEFENTDDWVEDGKDKNKIYYAKNRSLYYYYSQTDQKWNSTDKPYEAGLAGAISGVQQIADDNKAQLDAMVSYDKDGKSALAGLTAYVDENSASLNTLADYSNSNSGRSGIAGLVADVNENTSELSAVAHHTFTKDDGTEISGLAGLQAQVDNNTSEVSVVANRIAGKYTVIAEYPVGNETEISNLDQTKIYHSGTTTYWYYDSAKQAWVNVNGWGNIAKLGLLETDVVYYVGGQHRRYFYYDTTWKNTIDPYAAGLPSVVSGIQVAVDDNASKISSLTSWQGEAIDNMASIEQKADENGASITSLVSSIDKYSIGEYSQAYGLSLDQVRSILKTGMVYIPTVEHEETYGNITYKFSPTFYYVCDVSSSDLIWIEGIGKVWVNTTKPAGDDYLYWFDNSNLYTYDKDAKKWNQVSTLAGNVNNRITSMIKQEVDKVSLSIFGTEGGAAGIEERLNDTEAKVNSYAYWPTDNNKKRFNLSTIDQSANADGSSLALAIVDKQGENIIKGATLVLHQGNNGSFINLDADHVVIKGDTTTLLSDWANGTNESLSTITTQAGEDRANISALAQRVQKTYTVVAEFPKDESKRDRTKFYHSETSAYHYYSDGAWQKVSSWGALSTKVELDRSTVYYAGGTYHKYLYYNGNTWIATSEPYQAGLTAATAGIQVSVDDHESRISSIAEWKDGAVTNISQISQKADSNESKISSLTTWKDTTATSIASISQRANENESSITALTQRVKETYTVIEEFPGDGTLRDTSKFYHSGSDAYYHYYDKDNKEWEKVTGWSNIVNKGYVNQDTVYYAGGDYKKYLYYKNGWNATQNPYDAGLTTATAGLQSYADDNAALLNIIAEWKGSVEDDVLSIATMQQTATEEYAKISGLTQRMKNTYIVMPQNPSSNDTEALNNRDKSKIYHTNNATYTYYKNNAWTTVSGLDALVNADVLDTSKIYYAGGTYQKYIFYNGKNWGAVSDPYSAGLITSASGIQSYVDDNVAKVDLLSQRVMGSYTLIPEYPSKEADRDKSQFYHSGTGGDYYYYKNNTWNLVTGIANLAANVDLDESKVYYAGGGYNKYLYYDKSTWKAVADAGQAGLAVAAAKIQTSVNDHEAKIGLVVTDGKADGSLMIAAINGESTAKISADRLDIVGKKLNIKVDATNITGTLTVKDSSNNTLFSAGNNAVRLAGWTVDNNSIHAGTLGAANSMWLCRNGTTTDASIGGSNEISGWCIAVGDDFGVTKAGKLYASGVDLSGKITATSGKIGECELSDGVLSVGGWKARTSYLTGTASRTFQNVTYQDTIQISPTRLYVGSKESGLDLGYKDVAWYFVTMAGKSAQDSASDFRLKHTIEDFSDEYDRLFDALQPKRYKYYHGTSDRFHTGFIAQDIVNALPECGLSTQDFAAVLLENKSEDTGFWYLRRDEFVSLNTWQIQKLKARVSELEAKVLALEETINKN